MNIPIKKSVLIELLEIQRDNYLELASIAGHQCEKLFQEWKQEYLSKWWRRGKTFDEEFLRDKHKTLYGGYSVRRVFNQYAKDADKKIERIDKFAGDKEIYISEQELEDLQKTKKASRPRHFCFPACG